MEPTYVTDLDNQQPHPSLQGKINRDNVRISNISTNQADGEWERNGYDQIAPLIKEWRVKNINLSTQHKNIGGNKNQKIIR